MGNEQKKTKQVEMFSASAEIIGPVFYNRDISDRAKLLYGLIWAMTKPPKYYAFAHNETFQRFLGCSERSVQRCLAELIAAGEITVDDCTGGRKKIRKIKAVRLQPFNPDSCDGVNPDSCDGVTNNSIINNIPSRGRKRNPPEQVSKEELFDWLERWAVDLGYDRERTVALIGDLHAFAENRAAKGKPILTINAAGRRTKQLLDLSADYPETRIEAMRYILGEAISHNWEKLYPIDDRRKDDFARCLQDVCGIAPAAPEAGQEEYF